MKNELRFGSYTFDDDSIFSVNIATEIDPVCSALSADSLTATIFSDMVGDKKLYTVLMQWYHTMNDEGYVVYSGELKDYTYGEPILYYRDGSLYGKYYITQVDRVSDDQFEITATSAIGLLISEPFAGGVYSSVRAEPIINAIMAGTNIPYTIETAVKNTVCGGYIPYGNKRDALQQLCFPSGINIRKTDDGKLNFLFSLPTSANEIPDERIYLGGEKEYLAPATQITVTEHLYFNNPTAQVEEIYRHSGDAATNALIVLDEPIVPSTITHDSGITIIESAATYIRFSGSGTISAKKYTHVTQEKVWNADTVAGEEKTYNVSDATMVTALNSANVLSRLVKYYTQSKQTNCDIVVDGERAGDYVTFTDPYDNTVTGFIKKMDLDVSSVNKAGIEVVTDWYPTDTGNNFSGYQLIQNTGTITVPTAARGTAGRLVLIGGFRGGQGGSAGEDGKDCVKGEVIPQQGTRWTGGEGGKEGGQGGKGGVGCMVYSVDIASLPASFTVNEIGAGGAGGAAGAFQMEGSMGLLGGNTRVTINGTTYSSASGTENTAGFINFVDGTFYNYPGNDGFDNNTGYGGDGNYSSSSSSNKVGGPFTANGTTWTGGKSGSYASSGNSSYWGGAGGGAAYGANGNNGGNGSSSYYGYSGDGGAGATPITPTQASFPYGGNGGHGGGCGGGAGGGWTYYGMSNLIPGVGGKGGAGSPGGQGSNGAVIFYY